MKLGNIPLNQINVAIMSSPGGYHRRVLIACLLFVTVLGFWFCTVGPSERQEERPQRRRTVAKESPEAVRVTHSRTGRIEISNRLLIHLLDQLFPNYRGEAFAANPEPPNGEHYTLEFQLDDERPVSDLFVWTEDGVEYWKAGLNRLPVRGSFRQFVDWLPVRQAIGTTIYPTPDHVIGQKHVAENGDSFLTIALNNARQQTEVLQLWAVNDVLALIKSSLPRTGHQTAGYPTFQPTDGLVRGPLPVNMSRITDIRELALQRLNGSTLDVASKILALTADDAALDEIARRLDAESDPSKFIGCLRCLQGCIGIPKFESIGICLNAPKSEVTQFAASESVRATETKRKLLAWFAVWKRLPDDERRTEVVACWKSGIDWKPEINDSHWFDERVKRYWNLLQHGPVMLSAVESAQAQVTGLVARGQLEFFKAYWTGQCDDALVGELLNGDREAQRIACDIIAASADVSWKDQLTALLRTPIESDLSWHQLMDKVGETLVICHGVEALPILAEVSHLGLRSTRQAQKQFQISQTN